MKLKFLPAILFLACCVILRAANFSVSWSTVDSGGGTSTSADGRFSLSGTAGQPDAGVLSGAGFQLEGGYQVLAGPNIPIPPPRPAIRLAGTNIVVSWSAGPQGIVLEYADELKTPPSATVWLPVSPQPAGSSFTTPLTGTQRYFRLRSP